MTTPVRYLREWPDALDRVRSLLDGALRTRETAATPAGSRSWPPPLPSHRTPTAPRSLRTPWSEVL